MPTPTPQADGSQPELAFPVRALSTKLRDYIARLGRVWIEGQIVEISRRSGNMVFLTLRDVDTDASISVVLTANLDRAQNPPLAAGQRVLLHVQCEFWIKGGKLMVRAGEIRPVGIGQLLATLEQRKAALAAEGLFSLDLKRALPVLPRRIGLITGANAQAKQDVITNATLRWPAAHFEVREGPVQGAQAVGSMIAFLSELAATPQVDVIIFARGGGSLEDLLAFSDEALIRAVAACTTPVISAIGHEPDTPLLDLVADVRASTPTDAGKRVVPDLATELKWLTDRRTRIDSHIRSGLEQSQTWLDQTRRRPVMAEPGAWIPRQEQEVTLGRNRCQRAVTMRIQADLATLDHLRARSKALSPLATLERGYAVVVGPDGAFVRDAGELQREDALRIRVATGSFHAKVTQVASAS